MLVHNIRMFILSDLDCILVGTKFRIPDKANKVWPSISVRINVVLL